MRPTLELGLKTKGFLLVSVPLAFQLFVIINMWMLLSNEREVVAKEARTRDVIAICNRLTQAGGEIAAHVYPPPGSEFDSGPLTDTDIAAFRNSANELQRHLSAEPQERDLARRLKTSTDEFIPLVYAARDGAPVRGHLGRFASERKLVDKVNDLFDILTAIIASENTLRRDQPEERLRVRKRIQNFLTTAILSGAVLSVALAYVAAIGIRKPLARMSENAERISKRSPLQPALTGKDELAELDRLLHDVDTAIEEALTSERNLINYAADVVCSIDKEGICRSLNPYASELLGYAAHELIGKSIINVVADDDCDKVDRFLNETHADGGSRPFEVQMKRNEGELIQTAWSTIWSQRDQSFFCVVHDITERKQLERLKQDYIAMISHDLRTPLMSVHSSIDLVQSGATGPLEPQTDTELTNAGRSIEHLIELVNDLLDFEKLEAQRMDFEIAPIQLRVILDESVRLVKTLSDERNITINLPEIDIQIQGDERKLVQMLVNLISNALKHTDSGGVLQIESKPIGSFVQISVHDEGPGVPDEFVEKIFAPFEQISHRATAQLGTGLGLAICKLIVEGHHGTIGVRSSSILKGSEFWFTVPVASELS